jgi:hypothetical protein
LKLQARKLLLSSLSNLYGFEIAESLVETRGFLLFRTSLFAATALSFKNPWSALAIFDPRFLRLPGLGTASCGPGGRKYPSQPPNF